MTTITRERLQEVIDGDILFTDEQRELARIALASLTAEPALYAAEETLAYANMGELHLTCLSEPMGDAVIPLYTAPPASVSVPDALPENDDEEGNDIDYMEPSEVYALGRAAGWNACRAAMLQGADGNTQVIPDCTCRTCRPVTFSDSRFVVCPDCGNKRCPHANDHNNACTGSNDPGQVGSAYPAAPQQEVRP